MLNKGLSKLSTTNGYVVKFSTLFLVDSDSRVDNCLSKTPLKHKLLLFYYFVYSSTSSTIK